MVLFFRLRQRAYARESLAAVLHRSRHIGNWCDYAPAHRGVVYRAYAGSFLAGQACQDHFGALLRDFCDKKDVTFR
jgi:hypothetical protein